ncbi:helix-turn-helix transcriptional regulator [Krasilnikovia sp. M28-CT-15]|uniref:helix-turn-helix transcriptional regulator n=1 Tax=Krasilnikovia sp. M28-CT-15 TaxID=3373540 RepID=UPI0038774420
MVYTGPPLMGAHEIRVRLGGISRQRTYQITSRRDFPSPAVKLAMGKVWLAEDVEQWIRTCRPAQSGHDTIRPAYR